MFLSYEYLYNQKYVYSYYMRMNAKLFIYKSIPFFYHHHVLSYIQNYKVNINFIYFNQALQSYNNPNMLYIKPYHIFYLNKDNIFFQNVQHHFLPTLLLNIYLLLYIILNDNVLFLFYHNFHNKLQVLKYLQY